MALSATGFDQGLLGSINNNIVNQQKMQQEGATADYQNFEQAQKEYQAAKNKNADAANAMDNMASSLTPDGNPDAAAYSTARWAVENGYDKPEHLPYVQQAYKATYADMQANPDKWGVTPDRGTDVVGKTGLTDTNPTNTQHLHMFNKNLSTDDIENVRQSNISTPYGNLPSPVLPDAGKFADTQAYNKAMATNAASAEAKKDSATKGWVPLDDPSDHTQAPPPPGAGGDLAVNQSELQPGGKPDGGINLPGPAPAAIGATNATPHILPNGDPDPRPLNDGFIGRLQSASPVHASIIKQIADGKVPWPSTNGGRNQDEVEQLIAATNAYDPSASEQRYKAAQNTIDDFTKGQDHVQVDAINTAAAHTSELAKLATTVASNQTDTRLLNRLATEYDVQLSGKDDVTNYQLVAHKVAEEVTKAYQGSNVTKDAIDKTAAGFNAAASPQQIMGGINETAIMLKGKADAKDYEYKTGMGPAYDGRQLLTPQARDFFTKYAKDDSSADQIKQGAQDNAQGPQPSNQAPAQNLPSVKTPEDAMKLPPGSQFLTPDGRIGTVPGKPSNGQSNQ